MIRKFLSVLLILCMCAGMTTAVLAQENAPIAITLWSRSFEDWYNSMLGQQVDNYNALNRGYTVSLEFVAEAAWNERITAAQAAGNAPDLYTISYNHIVTEAKNQAIQPLDGLLSDEKLDDITESVRKMVSYNGKTYAFPMWTEPSALLYYRTDLLEEAGIDKVPTTWDELVEAASKLTTNSRFGLALMTGGDMGWSTWGWQYGISGHLAINDNWDAATIDDGYQALAGFFEKLYDAGCVPDQALSGYGDISPFATDAVAMQINGSWAVATLINDYPELEGKYGIAVCPTQNGDLDVCTATMGGWTLAIDGASKNAAGAADFISYLMCEDASVWGGYYELCHFCRSACTKSISEYVNQKSAEAGYDWAAVINDVASHAIAEPVYPWDISVSVQLMFENVFMHTMSMEEATQTCIDSINKIIADQNLAGMNPNK